MKHEPAPVCQRITQYFARRRQDLPMFGAHEECSPATDLRFAMPVLVRNLSDLKRGEPPQCFRLTNEILHLSSICLDFPVASALRSSVEPGPAALEMQVLCGWGNLLLQPKGFQSQR